MALILAVMMPVAAAIAVQPGVSSAAVTAVKGQAYGVAGDVTIFGGPQHKDPDPLVTLPPGSAATVPTLALQFGPAVFLRAGTSTVSSTGAVGPTGSVTSFADFGSTTDNGNTPCPNNPSNYYSGTVTLGSTTVTSPYINFTAVDTGRGINGVGIPTGAVILSVQSPTQATISLPATSSSAPPAATDLRIPLRGPGPGTCIYNSQFTADTAHVECTANESGVSGFTRFTNGLLATATDYGQNPTMQQTIPNNPPPNLTIDGSFELGSNDHESFTYIFNEQIRNPDGSVTVNASHLIPHGQTAIASPPTTQNPNFVNGIIFGSVTCGVTAVAPSTTTTLAPTTTTTSVPPAPTLRAVVDFDGNRTSDISVFRPGSGTWYVRGGSPEVTTYGGQTGDVAVPGDYDGDGKADTAIYRPSVGTWYVHNSATGTDTLRTYGVSTDIAVPADYDGDGKADIAVFRPSSAAWYVHQSSNNADVITTYGIGGDIPVVGDYDGDGKADIAVYRPSAGTWFVHKSTGGDTTVNYGGNAGDIPVPGDYDGDRKTDTAIYRPAAGTWYIHNSANNTDTLRTYGVSTDQPQPGDYDGDGKTDIAIFRPSSAAWYVANSASGSDTIVTYGIPGDVALPLPAAIRGFFF